MKIPTLLILLLLLARPHQGSAAELTASDGAAFDQFGISLSQSGGIGLVGAYGDDVGTNIDQGSAYVFRSLNTATGTITQNVKLTASDGAAGDLFGISVSLSGSIGLVGSTNDDIGANRNQGSAYVFRSLDTATGTVTQSVKLIASDGVGGNFDGLFTDLFGDSVSLSGSIGLVAAPRDDIGANTDQGSAYVFRNLDTATGTVTESVKLTASDGAPVDTFGSSVSLSGSIGLVGAQFDNHPNGAFSFFDNAGSAYVFLNLDTAVGIVTESVKLFASDRQSGDQFGTSVSLSGSIGLVAAPKDNIGANVDQGSAYVFRSLNTATDWATENVKLTASDGAASDSFGGSVSLSGSIGLVGSAYDDIGANGDQGSAYVFRSLDTATGTVTQSVKLIASGGAAGDIFGNSVSLDGDQFVIGANSADGAAVNSGKAYTGSVSSVTTLDTGNASRMIDGISFISQDDWIVGENTDRNSVTLGSGDLATVTASGKAVFVGKNAGSDGNSLTVQGGLTASRVNVGLQGRSVGNEVRLEDGGTLTGATVRLGERNLLTLQGDQSTSSSLMTALGSNTLQVWRGSFWKTVNASNSSALLQQTYDASGFTEIEAKSLDEIVKVDFNAAGGSPTETGWQGFNIATGVSSQSRIYGTRTDISGGALSVSISGSAIDSRDRNNPAADTANVSLSQLYRDFVTGDTLTFTIGGLMSGQQYVFNFFSYDSSGPTPNTITNTTGGPQLGTISGTINNAASLTFDGQYSLELNAVADASGRAIFSVSAVNNDGPRINGIEVSAVAQASDRGAAVLTPFRRNAGDDLGGSVSRSGNIALAGAEWAKTGAVGDAQGWVYVFRNLDTATGTVTENARLAASDGITLDNLGHSVSLSGTIGLVGAYRANIGANNDQGSAYVFRNLDTVTDTVTQNVKLTASDGAADDYFGGSVSLAGSIGLVTARGANNGTITSQGAAYVFRNLDTATGAVTQNAKLVASDRAANDLFGTSASLSGSIGLVGAGLDDIGANISQGSAYVFRNLDTVTGTVTQNVKLTASDGAADDVFGSNVSLSGSIGLVGAIEDDIGANTNQGSAYVFRNLDTATGTITQNVKLTASDGAANDLFGSSVSLSGSIGLVAAVWDDIGANLDQGSAYLFRNLDTATGTVTENLKLTASAGGGFGRSVNLSGDNFSIGGWSPLGGLNSGAAYVGTVSSMTILDAGNSSRAISGISFASQDDWIIGEARDRNVVTLGAGDSANVTSAGKAVFIGKNSTSDNNTLVVEGTLTANQINVGVAGNVGNTLQIGNGGTTGTLSASSVVVNNGRVVFNRSNGITQGTDFGSAAITGSGSLTQAGAGTLTLNTNNTYSGGTTVTSGTLVAAHHAALGSAGVLVANGTVLASAGTTIANNFTIGSFTPAATNAYTSVSVAGWDFSTNTGGVGNFGPSPMDPTASATGLNIGGLTRGSGVATSTSGSGAADAWGGSGFDAVSSAAAITAGDFATFTVSILDGYALNLTNIGAYNVRRSGTGPTTGLWQWSTNGTTFNDIGSAITWGATTTSGGNAQSAIALSAVSPLQALGTGATVTFRLVNYNASGAGGTWYLNDPNDTTAIDFALGGQIATVTPATYAGTGTLGLGQAGEATFSGNVLVNSTATLTATNGATAIFSGVISGPGTNITKTGAGTVTLSGGSANTFAGRTTVSEGTLQLNKFANTTALAGNVKVNSGASLLISASGQVADTSAVTLSGGTIQRGSGVSETFGNLDLTAASFLDFGGGTAGTLRFGTYTPTSLLTVSNFAFGNTLIFGSNLTASIASPSLFSFDNGFTYAWDDSNAIFTITAIPEPSTILVAAGLAALLLWPVLRRRAFKARA